MIKAGPHNLSVDSYFVARTYSGMLEGRPDAALNEAIFKDARITIGKLWGNDRPYHVLPAYKQPRDEKNPELLAYTFVAWLSSWRPIHDSEKCGSHLFLVWFQEEVGLNERILTSIFESQLQWEKVAKDFDV